MHLPSQTYETRDLLEEVGDGPERVISAEEYLQPQAGRKANGPRGVEMVTPFLFLATVIVLWK